MAQYPMLVRKRIIELYQQNFSTRKIAELFGVCESGVRRVRQRLRLRGTIENPPCRSGRKPIMTSEVEQRIRALIAERPDATRAEVRSELGLDVSLQSMSRWFKRLGLPLKKSRFMPRNRIVPMSPSDAQSGMSS